MKPNNALSGNKFLGGNTMKKKSRDSYFYIQDSGCYEYMCTCWGDMGLWDMGLWVMGLYLLLNWEDWMESCIFI